MKSAIAITLSLGLAVGISGLFLTTHARQASTPGAANSINLTATSANVSNSGSAVKISILRWSTDEERNSLISAMNPPPAPPPPAAGGAGGAGRGGRGAGGRGAGGRGGRGDGSQAADPADPVAALTAAIGKGPTIGYVWTDEVVGYSIKFAYRTALPNGGERIILATDRELGGFTTAWKPLAGAATDYQFTLLELRLDSKGTGEAKTSLTAKISVDKEINSIALDNYAAASVMLQNVKR
jgi:hypothetical protein